MFDFIQERTVFKMNDAVFTSELRNRVVAEFAHCPDGSVLFASTNIGAVDDDRVTPWAKVDDPAGRFRSYGYSIDIVQPMFVRTVCGQHRAHSTMPRPQRVLPRPAAEATSASATALAATAAATAASIAAAAVAAAAAPVAAAVTLASSTTEPEPIPTVLSAGAMPALRSDVPANTAAARPCHERREQMCRVGNIRTRKRRNKGDAARQHTKRIRDRAHLSIGWLRAAALLRQLQRNRDVCPCNIVVKIKATRQIRYVLGEIERHPALLQGPDTPGSPHTCPGSFSRSLIFDMF